MAFYKAPKVNFFSTTLNGAIDNSVTTITLNSVTGLQFPGVLIIDREDGNGSATPNSREVINYTGISGNDLTGCTRAADSGTARSHSNGALVEATITVGLWNDLRDAVASSLTTDGSGIALSGTASIATMVVTNDITRFVTTSVASIARVENNFFKGVSGAFSSVVSVARGEFTAIQATSVASIAMPDKSIRSRHLASGMYRTSGWSEFTSTSTSFVDATGVAVASVVLDVASDVEVCLQLEYTKNSATGSSQNQFQLLYGSTVIGAEVFLSIPSANQNYPVFIRKTVQNLAAGTYTFKLQVKNNAAGTITVGLGEMTVQSRATGV